MDTDIISTVVLYAPGVAILLWVNLKQQQMIESLTDKCILLRKDCGSNDQDENKSIKP